jgi:hypothetical protein
VNPLKLYTQADVVFHGMDALFTDASEHGDEVTGKPGRVLLVVRNQLEDEPREATFCWDLTGESPLTVPPGESLTIGPIGLTDLHGGIVADDEIRAVITYPRRDGLQVCALEMYFPVSY